MLLVLSVFAGALAVGIALSDVLLRADRSPALARLAGAALTRHAAFAAVMLLSAYLTFHLYVGSYPTILLAGALLIGCAGAAWAARASLPVPETGMQAAIGALALALLVTEGALTAAAAGHFPMSYPAYWDSVAGRRSTPALTAAVRSPDSTVRVAAIRELVPDAPAGHDVIAAAADDPDPVVRRMVIGYLVANPDGGLSILARHALDPDRSTREVVKEALLRSFSTVGNGAPRTPQPPADSARAMGALLEAVIDQPHYGEGDISKYKLRHAFAASKTAEEALIHCFQGGVEDCPSDPTFRGVAAEMLCSVGPEGLKTALAARKTDPVPEVLAGAARGMGQVIDQSREEQVREWESVWDVHMAAYASNEETFRPDAVPLMRNLAGLLRDQDAGVRLAAGTALVKALNPDYPWAGRTYDPRNPDCRLQSLKLPEVQTAALSTLQDPDPAVREQAAKALGLLGDKRAIPVLEQADLHSEHPNACDICGVLSGLGVRNLRHRPYPDLSDR